MQLPQGTDKNLLTEVQEKCKLMQKNIQDLQTFRESLGIYEPQTEDVGEKIECEVRSIPTFSETWNSLPDVLSRISGNIFHETQLIEDCLMKDQRAVACGSIAEKDVPYDHIEKVRDAILDMRMAVNNFERFVSTILSVSNNAIKGEGKTETCSFRDLWESIPLTLNFNASQLSASLESLKWALLDPEPTSKRTCDARTPSI
ncbi:MAG: hypothetical protein WC119_02270 [Synergistaceae bacterium]